MCYTWLFFSPQECNCGPSVPPDIRKAVREHLKKRRKLQQQSIFGQSQRLNIQQHRELVKRESSGFSVWKLVLPRCHDIVSDPIVEYRNSHRVIFIKQMPEVSKYAARYIKSRACNATKKQLLTPCSYIFILQNATIHSIGEGIIGSAAEENSRKLVNWKQGSSYFLPCSSCACGWVNKTTIGDERSSSSSSDHFAKNRSGDDDVILYTLKVSPDDLEMMRKEDETQQLSPWVAKAIQLFGLIDNEESCDEIMLSLEQCAKMSEIIDLLLN